MTEARGGAAQRMLRRTEERLEVNFEEPASEGRDR
jgi:hypothetical protein